MKTLVSIVFLVAISMVLADELSDCKCGHGFEAAKNTEGKVECRGILVFMNKPCNQLEYPRCECSGPVTGVLKDKTGTWCSQYKNGVEQKKWACENKAEWDDFYKQHPEAAL